MTPSSCAHFIQPGVEYVVWRTLFPRFFRKKVWRLPERMAATSSLCGLAPGCSMICIWIIWHFALGGGYEPKTVAENVFEVVILSNDLEGAHSNLGGYGGGEEWGDGVADALADFGFVGAAQFLSEAALGLDEGGEQSGAFVRLRADNGLEDGAKKLGLLVGLQGCGRAVGGDPVAMEAAGLFGPADALVCPQSLPEENEDTGAIRREPIRNG